MFTVDKEIFFLGKLISNKTLISPSFIGADQARQAAENLATTPDLRHFPQAQKIIRYHELAHALSDPETQGHITMAITHMGINIKGKFYGIRFAYGTYHTEGRPRTYQEMKQIVLGVDRPSFVDRLCVMVNRHGKRG